MAEQKGALETNETKLIFVQDHAIHHHSVAGPGVMDSDGNTHFNPCFHDVFIQDLTAARHVVNAFAEAIMPRTLVSLSTIVLPGLYSVIVPLASVVVVVVVVSET